MAQKNDLVLKRQLLIDGDEIPGLVNCPEINDEEGTVEVPGFSRVFTVKNGVKKFNPLDVEYKVSKGTKTHTFFRDWFYNNETHDLTIVGTDAVGTPLNKWLARDCECASFKESAYNAASPEYFKITMKITCTSSPVSLDI